MCERLWLNNGFRELPTNDVGLVDRSLRLVINHRVVPTLSGELSIICVEIVDQYFNHFRPILIIAKRCSTNVNHHFSPSTAVDLQEPCFHASLIRQSLVVPRPRSLVEMMWEPLNSLQGDLIPWWITKSHCGISFFGIGITI